MTDIVERLRIWDDPGETICTEAAAEIDQLRKIRELCIKALMVATGATRQAIEASPVTCAKEAADEIEALRDQNELLRDTKGCTILDQKEEIEQLHKIRELWRLKGIMSAKYRYTDDEIGQLNAEIKRLRTALAEAADLLDGDGEYPATARRFRALLAGDERSVPVFCADHPRCQCGIDQLETCNWKPEQSVAD